MIKTNLWKKNVAEYRWVLCCGKCGEAVGYWERDKSPVMCPECSCMVTYPQSTGPTTTTNE